MGLKNSRHGEHLENAYLVYYQAVESSVTRCQSSPISGKPSVLPMRGSQPSCRVRFWVDTCWEREDSPRLLPTDLENPVLFRQRLEDWLKRQK